MIDFKEFDTFTPYHACTRALWNSDHNYGIRKCCLAGMNCGTCRLGLEQHIRCKCMYGPGELVVILMVHDDEMEHRPRVQEIYKEISEIIDKGML